MSVLSSLLSIFLQTIQYIVGILPTSKLLCPAELKCVLALSFILCLCNSQQRWEGNEMASSSAKKITLKYFIPSVQSGKWGARFNSTNVALYLPRAIRQSLLKSPVSGDISSVSASASQDKCKLKVARTDCKANQASLRCVDSEFWFFTNIVPTLRFTEVLIGSFSSFTSILWTILKPDSSNKSFWNHYITDTLILICLWSKTKVGHWCQAFCTPIHYAACHWATLILRLSVLFKIYSGLQCMIPYY